MFCYASIGTFIWFGNVIYCQWRIRQSSTEELSIFTDNNSNFITSCTCFDPCYTNNIRGTWCRACYGVALTFNNICICRGNVDCRSFCKIKCLIMYRLWPLTMSALIGAMWIEGLENHRSWTSNCRVHPLLIYTKPDTNACMSVLLCKHR